MVANKPLQNYSVSKGKDELVCQQPSLRLDFPGGSDGKASVYNAGDLGSIPGSGRTPGEGNGNPLQYSRLENPMDGGAESDTTEQLHFHLPLNILT